MRRLFVFSSALLLGSATVGCIDGYSNPEAWGNTTTLSGTGGAGGDTGTGGTSGTSGTGGTTTSAPPECIPGNASMPVEDTCGIFVSASKGSDADGKGTKDSPVQTLAKGLELAAAAPDGPKPVYVCGETFTGPIEITKSGLVYGALDCATDWKYLGDQGHTVITAEADNVPLQIRGSAGLEMHDFNVTALDAVAMGGSSIGILLEAATSLTLVSGVVEVGIGAPGANANDAIGMGTPGQDGAPGSNACTAAVVVGGVGPVKECGDVDSVGGLGGTGAAVSGGAGSPGNPGGVGNPNGGGGEDVNNQCGHGKPGGPGGVGDPGPGATLGMGSLNPNSGYSGLAGTDGQPGKPGQGGGGGGGGLGGTGANQCVGAMNGGASGGSGGSGGCGGAGGKGGAAGGASIAIVTLGGSLKLGNVKVTAKNGGPGGNGGLGQVGGDGGNWGAAGAKGAASALNDACHGGVGGKGGMGGMGGGGMGGHSIGVAYKGATTPDTTGAQFVLGSPGIGGLGDGDAGKGADGIAQDTESF